MRDVQGIDGMVAEEIAGMIQGHKNHHRSSGNIDFRETIRGHRSAWSEVVLKKCDYLCLASALVTNQKRWPIFRKQIRHAEFFCYITVR